jgi:hypothetical protein
MLYKMRFRGRRAELDDLSFWLPLGGNGVHSENSETAVGATAG